MVALALVLLLAVTQLSGRSWDLGRGFRAVASEGRRVAGGPIARRTLEIRRGGELLQQFRSTDAGLGVQVADVTGDGIRDVLALDYQDGSGGCGIYRLYGGPRFRELWVRFECADIGVVRLQARALVLWAAVLSSKTRASGGSPHCCWRTWRRTQWRWRGGHLQRARSWLGPPPPPSYQVRLLPGTFPARALKKPRASFLRGR
jgi:hypothetical protein